MPAIDYGPLITAASGLAVAVGALLAVAAALLALYINVKAVRIFVSTVHGRLELDRQEKEFRRMYAREQKRRAYRQWQAAQIGPRRRRRWQQ